jgi:hypothetical protein
MVSDRGPAAGAPGRAPVKAAARTSLLASRPLRWIGTWSTSRAVLVFLGLALLSLVATIVIDHDPGFLIGFFLLVESVIAAAAIRRAVYRLIPLPALSYLVTTTVAGTVHDRANLNDSHEFITSFLTWIGSAFFALLWSTALIVVIAIVRAMIAWRRPAATRSPATGPQSSRPAAAPRPGLSGRAPRAATPRVPRSARGASAGWDAAQDPYGERAPGGNAFGDTHVAPDAFAEPARGNRASRGEETRTGADLRGGRPARDDRGSRDERDSWDDRDVPEPRPARDRRPARLPEDDEDSWDDDRGGRDDRRPDPYPGSPGARRPRPPDGPRDLW